jgi:nitrogen-specific signal transduction histidine kinase
VRLVADSHVAVLTVADSGPGLAPDMRERLFQPFSAGGPRAGSGLGLAICLEIVQSLGGQIELNNRQIGAARRAWMPSCACHWKDMNEVPGAAGQVAVGRALLQDAWPGL